MKACGWNSEHSQGNDFPPCIAIAKGGYFNDNDANRIQLAMKTHTKAKYVTFAGKDRRLNVEDSGSYNPSRFGAKYYALRNDSYYMLAPKSITDDSILNFVSKAISTPHEEYTHHTSPISLVKNTAGKIKEYGSDKAKKKSKKSSTGAKLATDEDTMKENMKNDDDSNQAEEFDKRQKREKEARERMAREEKEYLFEDIGEGEGDVEGEKDDEEDLYDDDEYDESEDADIIEL